MSAFILEPAKTYDMWTAVFETDGRTGSATLGLHGKAMHIQDLDDRMSTRELNTGSDVMAICKRQVRAMHNDIVSLLRSNSTQCTLANDPVQFDFLTCALVQGRRGRPC